MKWVRCVLDLCWHAIEERRDHLPGVYRAECGHLVPRAALHDEPPGRPCELCAMLQLVRAVIHCEDDQISGRPPVEPPPPRSPRPAGSDE